MSLKKIFKVCFKIVLFVPVFWNMAQATEPAALPKQVIIFIWDGLRPDLVTPTNTPNLYALGARGVQFVDSHSTYPTFTMMNAASLATGDYARQTGFFGNVVWQPSAKGTSAAGEKIHFKQPVNTQDYKVLQELDNNNLLFVGTLFQAAHAKDLITATVGKSGAAFLQDYKSQGIILDEKHVYPLSFAQQLLRNGYSLPLQTPLAFPLGSLLLKPDNDNPTGFAKVQTLADGVTSNPTTASGSPFMKANQYMMNVYLNAILTKIKPQLSVVWLRDPDMTAHAYGPGSANVRASLTYMDNLLGALESKIDSLNLKQSTDIIVISDHGTSTVSGPLTQFPLRAITNKKVGAINTNGYSVSGEVRSADLLTQAGFHAYDGEGCRYDPVLSGIQKDGKPLYATRVDTQGVICGEKGANYTTPAYKVPKVIPADAIIIASNGGSDYFYIPSHDKAVLQKLITFLQSHEQYGAVFVNDQYGPMNGTLLLSNVDLQNSQGRSPDVIASFNYDENARINGLVGTELSDHINMRGMHGAFSPIDVHNFMVAVGPDFQQGVQDKLPVATVDIAPTVAQILQLKLPHTDGRVLREALINGTLDNYHVLQSHIGPSQPSTDLVVKDALGAVNDKHSYTIDLGVKALTDATDHRTYTYFDYAKAIRK